jgi:hypothetical protein
MKHCFSCKIAKDNKEFSPRKENTSDGLSEHNIENLKRAICYLEKDYSEATVIPLKCNPNAYRKKAG